MKRTGVVIVVLVVLACAGAAVGVVLARLGGGTIEVKGIIGSEKKAFFDDPAVQGVFKKRGFTYRTDAVGSLEMSGQKGDYDFAFPSSVPAAQELAQQRPGARTPVTVFSSPLAIATFSPIVDVLQVAKLAERGPDGVWTLDLKALVEKNQANLRWDQIEGNAAYSVKQNVLVATTEPQDSNSAAMFAVLLNQVTGGNVDKAAKLFSDQGRTDRTSGEPFESYLARGMNFAPMVLIYEAQFVDYATNTDLAKNNPDKKTLIYPKPTMVCAHTVVPFTDAGVGFADLLRDDKELQGLAAKHGFRTIDPTVSRPVLDEVRPGDAALPNTINGAVDAPTQTDLNTLLTKVEEKLRS